MNRKEKIDTQIRKTMDFLDKPETLPPDPFFSVRLKARLERGRQRKIDFVAVLSPALLVLLFILNTGITISYLNSSRGAQKSSTRTAGKELIGLLQEDFYTQQNSTDIFQIK